LDAAGNLYIADTGNYVIRKVSAATGIITTIAGNGRPGDSGDGGPATSAEVSPEGIAVDKAGNIILAGYRVRKIDAVTGHIGAVAGNGATGYSGDYIPAPLALLNTPVDVAVDTDGNIYIADNNNVRIRKVLFGTVGFGSQKVGSSSSSQAIKLVNVGGSAVQITKTTMSGSNAGDYSMVNSCGPKVDPAKSCTVSVNFKPTGTGERSASLIVSQAGGAQTAVGLLGFGQP
jgi:sugar lactone lactonase YvrE